MEPQQNSRNRLAPESNFKFEVFNPFGKTARRTLGYIALAGIVAYAGARSGDKVGKYLVDKLGYAQESRQINHSNIETKINNYSTKPLSEANPRLYEKLKNEKFKE